MVKFTNNPAFSQVALFTILLIIIIYMGTRNPLATAVVGIAAFYLGINGYLENYGIGIKCDEYIKENFICIPRNQGTSLPASAPPEYI